MKKNHSLTAALAVTTIASSLVLFSLSASAVNCNFPKRDDPQPTNNISPSSLTSSNQVNPNGNQWSIWGIGTAIATGLFGTGMALKYAIKRRQAEVVAETAISEPEFPEVSSFAIVIPPEALVHAQETEADLVSVGQTNI